MRNYSGKNQEQKEFLKLFGRLAGAHSRWEVWKDMIVIFATAISNAVDSRYRDQREEQYKDAMSHYSPERQRLFSELFAMLVLIMDEQWQQGELSDFLGEIFMNLNLGNAAGGQFFTPYDICRMMAQTTMNRDTVLGIIEKQGYVSINDPTCGAGATLIAAAETMLQMDINYQRTAIFVAQDIDYKTALMCYVQLSLLGCAGYVHIGNTLTKPTTGPVLHGYDDANTWYTPMWFSDHWELLRAFDRIKRRTTCAQAEHAKEQSKTITVSGSGQLVMF